MPAYYNENDSRKAVWLSRLMQRKLIAAGDIDERSILSVHSEDLRAYTQCHFFAGLGGWSLALRLAGWPDSRPVWTASTPCRFKSTAAHGNNKALDLWPEMRRLLNGATPFFGEQVANSGEWFDGVCNDLEAVGYTVGATILPACSVGKDHIRKRLYFAGHPDRDRKSERSIHAETSWMFWDSRNTRDISRTHGLSPRMVMRGYGDAIVAPLAAEFIKAYMDVT